MRSGLANLVRPLRQRDFALLASGQSLSNLGDALFEVALPLLALTIGSATDLGVVLGCYGVSRIAGLLLAAPAVSRFGARTVMTAVDVARALLMAVLGTMALTGGLTVAHLIVFTIPNGLCMGLFRPAYSSLTPRLVPEEQLPSANAVLTTSVQCAMLVGAAAGGIIAGASGVGVALLINAATFVASTVSLVAMARHHVPPDAVPDRTGQLRSLFSAGRTTLGALAGGHGLVVRLLSVVALVNLLWGGLLEVSLPSLLKRDFDNYTAAYGILLAASAAGALVGALLIGGLPGSRQTGRLAFAAGLGQGLLLVVVPWTGDVYLAGAAMLGVGVLNSVTNVIMVSLIQVATPPDRLPHVMSLMWLLSFGMFPVSVLATGLLATHLGPPAAMVVAGAALALGFLAGLTNPALARSVTAIAEQSATP
ncbi:MFS transporter [Actinosynnema sp. CS-041913]|uniref:MFS transporter n=1 Tax=Actinosynnema sp. CS-041913 TaxID=3239917 RepID=UPI003D92558C